MMLLKCSYLLYVLLYITQEKHSYSQVVFWINIYTYPYFMQIEMTIVNIVIK